MAKQRTTDRASEPPADEEALAFRAAVRDVKRLAHTPLPDGLSKSTARTRRRRVATEMDNIDTTMPLVDPLPVVEGSGEQPVIAGADALSFQRAGVRTQVMRRLRRGLFPIEDELDLHGLTQTVARDYLAQFLSRNREAGRRCVRIIHGKGYRSGARGPILKIAVDSWLRRHLDVMAFTSARPIDGGTGAVYVLLRA
jgi:DNA-nicking Smr family endonuclease